MVNPFVPLRELVGVSSGLSGFCTQNPQPNNAFVYFSPTECSGGTLENNLLCCHGLKKKRKGVERQTFVGVVKSRRCVYEEELGRKTDRENKHAGVAQKGRVEERPGPAPEWRPVNAN